MQKNTKIKDTLIDIINSLEIQRTHLCYKIDELDRRIKINKKAGNVAELENFTPKEKENLQTLIKIHITENSEETPYQHPPTTAKKLMPKMKEKV